MGWPGEASGMTDQKTFTPKDPARLSRAVVIWLAIHAGAAALCSATTLMDIGYLSTLDPTNGPIDADSIDINGLASLLLVAVTLVVWFLTLKWIYRASRNAHALATGLRMSPAWTIGSYFVPIAAFWKPFQGLADAWRVSADPHAWRSVPTPGILRIWWALWLIGNFIASGSARAALQAHTPGELLTSDWISIVHYVADVALDIVFIILVRRLNAMQVHQLEGLTFT